MARDNPSGALGRRACCARRRIARAEVRSRFSPAAAAENAARNSDRADSDPTKGWRPRSDSTTGNRGSSIATNRRQSAPTCECRPKSRACANRIANHADPRTSRSRRARRRSQHRRRYPDCRHQCRHRRPCRFRRLTPRKFGRPQPPKWVSSSTNETAGARVRRASRRGRPHGLASSRQWCGDAPQALVVARSPRGPAWAPVRVSDAA
jgi:hypothetical protein